MSLTSLDDLLNRFQPAADGTACLILADSTAEITLEPVHLETLRDQLPGVLEAVGVVDAAEKRGLAPRKRFRRVSSGRSSRPLASIRLSVGRIRLITTRVPSESLVSIAT